MVHAMCMGELPREKAKLEDEAREKPVGGRLYSCSADTHPPVGGALSPALLRLGGMWLGANVMPARTGLPPGAPLTHSENNTSGSLCPSETTELTRAALEAEPPSGPQTRE